jgi:hypothetical protein
MPAGLLLLGRTLLLLGASATHESVEHSKELRKLLAMTQLESAFEDICACEHMGAVRRAGVLLRGRTPALLGASAGDAATQ